MDAAAPTWPLVVLAAIQLADAAACIKPIASVAACFDDVHVPRRIWWVFTPIKLTAALVVAEERPRVNA